MELTCHSLKTASRELYYNLRVLVAELLQENKLVKLQDYTS